MNRRVRWWVKGAYDIRSLAASGGSTKMAGGPAMNLHRSALFCLLSLCIACGEDPPGIQDTGMPPVDPDGGMDTPDTGPVIGSDVDMDGQDDDWERAHGLDPARDDSQEDLDGDGILNGVEF